MNFKIFDYFGREFSGTPDPATSGAPSWSMMSTTPSTPHMRETSLCDPAKFTVTVKDGIVTIEGAPETAAVGRDIIESAKHVEAVVAVRDRLTHPPAERYTPNPMF